MTKVEKEDIKKFLRDLKKSTNIAKKCEVLCIKRCNIYGGTIKYKKVKELKKMVIEDLEKFIKKYKGE